MHWFQKILLVVCCMMAACMVVDAKDEKEGIAVMIQDDMAHHVAGEQIQIRDETGRLIGEFISDENGRILLPFLPTGEYQIVLKERSGYIKKETMPLSITAYNQQGAMELTIVMEKKQKTHTKKNPSLLLFFFALLNSGVYMMYYGWHKIMFDEQGDDEIE